MSELPRERQEVAEAGDTFEQKHQRSMDALNEAFAATIKTLRLVGPVAPKMPERYADLLKGGHSSGIAYCQFCNPPERQLRCPKCDYETPDRWRMKVHNILAPSWCDDRAAKKARVWAADS